MTTTPARGVSRRQRMDTVAIHEAGHSVIAASLGLPLGRVSIIPAGPTRGAAFLARHFGAFEPPDLLLMILSGPAAEAKYAGVPSQYDAGDRAVAREMAALMADADPDSPATAAILRRYEARACAIVTVHWAKIEKLAAALVRKHELSSAEVHELMWVKVKGGDCERQR